MFIKKKKKSLASEPKVAESRNFGRFFSREHLRSDFALLNCGTNCLRLVSPTGKNLFIILGSSSVARNNCKNKSLRALRLRGEARKRHPRGIYGVRKPIIGRKALCHIVYRVNHSHTTGIPSCGNTEFFTQLRCASTPVL